MLVLVVILVKHLDEINQMFNTTFAQISQWMNTVILRLAEHETEAVLITSRKRVEESCSTTFRLTYLKVVDKKLHQNRLFGIWK